MDKGVALCSPSSRTMVLSMGLRAHQWPHGSPYESMMSVGPLQWSRWWNECSHDIIQVLGHLPRVLGPCGGLLDIVYQSCHHHPKSESLVDSEYPWRSVECCLLLLAHGSLCTPYMCQCGPLGIRIPYREAKPKWKPLAILHKIQCVP